MTLHYTISTTSTSISGAAHIGSTQALDNDMKRLNAGVVDFQADGDELDAILWGLQNYHKQKAYQELVAAVRDMNETELSWMADLSIGPNFEMDLAFGKYMSQDVHNAVTAEQASRLSK